LYIANMQNSVDIFYQMNQILNNQFSFSGYHQTFRCYPVAMLKRDDVEATGKIVLPPSALDSMSRLNLTYPLLFELTNHAKANKKIPCGVLEFIAEEGRMYIPKWMMDNLEVGAGDFVKLRTVSLPLGTYVKFQPQSKTFLDISNQRAVLENVLRSFAALGIGQMVMINYNNKQYYLKVLELKPPHPSGAVSIIETDMIVDFAPPLDYEEPKKAPVQEAIVESSPKKKKTKNN